MIKEVLRAVFSLTPARRRAFGALLFLGGTAAAMGGVAVAQPGQPSTTTVVMTQSNWYWREQESNIAGTGVAPPSPLSDPTVPTGDLTVAGPEVNSQPDKETYLEYDVSALPAGSTITSFVVTLPVDSKGTNQAPSGMAPPMVACLPKGSWSGGPGAQSLSAKPADNCATDAPRVTSKDGGKAYTADITSIANRWLSSGLNVGVAITDDPQNTSTPYQVVFGPADAIAKLTASVSYELPASSESAVTSMPSTTIVGGSATSGSSSEGEPLPSSSYLPSVSPAPLAPSGPSGSGSTAAAPPGAGQNPPSQAGATSAPGNQRAIGSLAGSRGGSVPPSGFWLMAFFLLLLLVAMSIVLGNPLRAQPLRVRRLRLGPGALSYSPTGRPHASHGTTASNGRSPGTRARASVAAPEGSSANPPERRHEAE